MIDMINHFSDDQCTTEVIHLKWELEKSKQKREQMNYRRLRKKFDLREVLPESKFVTKRNKTGLVTFVDNFSDKKMYKDHKHLTDQDELLLAVNVTEKILVENESVQIWDIPKLLPDDKEDNDSDDEPIEIENDFNIEMNHLRKKITLGKQQPKITLPKNPEKSHEEFQKEQELMRQSFYNRDKIFGLKIAKTHLETDYEKYSRSIEERNVDSDEEEGSGSSMDRSYSQEQDDFPWYSVNDSDVSWIWFFWRF